MSQEPSRHLENLYQAALEQEPGMREAFLKEACGSDADLRRQVESLLANGAAVAISKGLPADSGVTQVIAGTHLGPYRVDSLLGSGGMGVVYKAHDTRLGREVAIKISTERFSGRFEREARAIAALNHSHICTLYDVGPNFLVMECVQGETLASRLHRGALPLEPALRYAAQMADALATAHSRGIVHRDLKPGNVMITPSGIKLLDFGVAHVGGNETLTAPGMVLGTPAYMSPEQREGRECDARSDIFALGLVVWEMVTGRKWLPSSLPEVTIPAQLDHVLRRCLAENPADRWQAASDVRRELEWVAESRPPAVPGATIPRSRYFSWIAMAAALFGVLVVVAMSVWFPRRKQPAPALSRFQIVAPEGTVIFGQTSDPSVALAPDGRKLAFAAQDGTGKTFLWVHDFSSFSSRRLEGTEGARRPFWSPDSQFIGYFDGARIKQIAQSGGYAQSICEASGFSGATWNREGVILFTGGSGLKRVSAAGGTLVPITTPDRKEGETDHSWPQFLPDGSHFLYLARHIDARKNRIFVQALDSRDRTLLLENATRAVYTSSGHLLFVRSGTLFGQSLDLKQLRLTSEPFSVADGVASGIGGSSSFTVSDNGVLAFRSPPVVSSQIVWYDRQGRRLRSADAGLAGEFSQIGISPDETRLIIDRFDGVNSYNDFWLLDSSGASLSRLTLDQQWKSDPLWSQDSRRIVFSMRNRSFHETDLSSGSTAVLYSSPTPIFLDDWSPDGRFLVYHSGADVFLLPLSGERKPVDLFRFAHTVDGFRFSPDSSWMAYNSNETGAHEVYVAPLDSFARKRQISRGGGMQPLWRADGAELFYLAPDGQLMAVDVKAGTGFEAGVPKALFQTGLKPSPYINTYAAIDHGKGFLAREVTSTPVNQIKLVLNWTSGLRR